MHWTSRAVAMVDLVLWGVAGYVVMIATGALI